MLCLEGVAVAWRFGGAGFPSAAGETTLTACRTFEILSVSSETQAPLLHTCSSQNVEALYDSGPIYPTPKPRSANPAKRKLF